MIKYPIQILLAIVVVFSFTSCENEPLEGEFPITTNPSDPGTPTDPGEGSTGDYWPTAVGNIWNFETLNADGTTNENDYQFLSETTFEGLSAFEFDNFFIDSQLESPGTATLELPGYLVKNEGNYSYYNPGFEENDEGFITSLEPFSYVFFRDYEAAGDSFTGSFTFSISISSDGDNEFEPIELIAEVDYEVTTIERDFSMTINGETFENVIHIVLSSSYVEEEFNETIAAETEIYFSKDVGPIKIIDNDANEGFISDIIFYQLN